MEIFKVEIFSLFMELGVCYDGYRGFIIAIQNCGLFQFISNLFIEIP